MSKSSFQNDVPWRASSSSAKPIPKIHHSPILRVSQNPFSDYAISIMRVSLFFTFHPLSSFKFSFFFFFLDFLQHPDPIGDGLGDDAIVEAAGPECIIPGQATPIKLLGLKVPISCFKFCIRNQIKLCELWSTDTDMWTLILV